MKTKFFILGALIFISSNLYSQNITNTLGNNGLFYIKDNSKTFLWLNQSNGYLGLGNSPTQQLDITNNFKLSNTTDSSKGVVYKETARFLHNYSPVINGDNTFLGVNSGNFTMSGFNVKKNTGIGTYALNKLTAGNSNTSIGSYSLFNNTYGSGNSALGTYSLEQNNGRNNVAIGLSAMRYNVEGEYNSAIGSGSLVSNTSGDMNSALGSSSLMDNTTGQGNTGIGTLSLASVTTGNNNTALGYNTGTDLITGSNNTIIGFSAQTTSFLVSNQIVLGNDQITSLRCNVQSITSLSDRRDKKNVNELSLGLDFISKLQPRQFNWDRREWYENNISDGSKTEEKLTAGFIAQELDEIQSVENAEWLGLVNKDNPDKIEATYGNLLPVMVKAIQELNEKNEILMSENQNLRTELSSLKDLKEKLASLETLQAGMKKEIELMKENKTVNEVKVDGYK